MADQTRLSISNLRTTMQIIKQTTATFNSNFFTLILLSILLFAFRTLIENGTRNLTRDASLDSFFSRLDLADRNYRRLHPRRPTFDLDDPFTGKDNADSSSLFSLPSNGSSVILQNIDPNLGFCSDDGVELPEIVNSGIEFDAEKNDLVFEGNGNDDDKESKEGDDEENGFSQQDMNLRFFIAIFVPGYYLLVIVGFTVLYSCISGIVFVVVANDLLGRHDSCISEVVWVGAKVGVKKLTWFFCLRWAVRNAESHGIGLLFVPRIYDRYFLFKLFIWLKLIPFSIVFPWFFELERYMPMYFLIWWALDEVVALVMALDCWITIDSSRRTGFEIMKEGYDLISRMWHQAVLIKCYEHVIVEGTAARYHLSRVFGEVSASILQSIFSVYFTVAWVIIYLVTRCKEADLGGRRFGRKELEGLIDGLK